MDHHKRAQLVERIMRLNALPSTMPVVPLEAFFDGNDELGSIGCNLGDHPGVHAFFETRTRDGSGSHLVGLSKRG